MALTLEETKRLDKLNFANGCGYSDFFIWSRKTGSIMINSFLLDLVERVVQRLRV